jgi:cytochrome c oxidase subunit IV
LKHAMERGAEHAAEPHPIHVPSDTVTLPFINQTITVPGGIYSVVFGVLAILTIIEVLLSVIPEEGAATLVTGLITATLVLFSTIKAFLVAWFYMHLNHDNKLFRWILLVPVGLALVAAIYLLAVPSTGYTLSTP